MRVLILFLFLSSSAHAFTLTHQSVGNDLFRKVRQYFSKVLDRSVFKDSQDGCYRFDYYNGRARTAHRSAFSMCIERIDLENGTLAKLRYQHDFGKIVIINLEMYEGLADRYSDHDLLSFNFRLGPNDLYKFSHSLSNFTINRTIPNLTHYHLPEWNYDFQIEDVEFDGALARHYRSSCDWGCDGMMVFTEVQSTTEWGGSVLRHYITAQDEVTPSHFSSELQKFYYSWANENSENFFNELTGKGGLPFDPSYGSFF